MDLTSGKSESGYSSTVKLTLIVGDHAIEVAATGPDSCRVRSPRSLPACEAELVTQVDNIIRREKVFLPQGATEESDIIFYEPI